VLLQLARPVMKRRCASGLTTRCTGRPLSFVSARSVGCAVQVSPVSAPVRPQRRCFRFARVLAMTKRELMDQITYGEGTVDEAEQWLSQLQQMDPFFFESDHMLQLEDIVKLRRRAQVIRSQMDSPPSPEQIAQLLDSIDYETAQSGEALEDMEAREAVVDSIFPHPDTKRYLDELLSEGTSTEEAVVLALSHQPKATFNLPGPVDEHWHQE